MVAQREDHHPKLHHGLKKVDFYRDFDVIVTVRKFSTKQLWQILKTGAF